MAAKDRSRAIGRSCRPQWEDQGWDPPHLLPRARSRLLLSLLKTPPEAFLQLGEAGAAQVTPAP